jgi:hypothetical protein
MLGVPGVLLDMQILGTTAPLEPETGGRGQPFTFQPVSDRHSSSELPQS